MPGACVFRSYDAAPAHAFITAREVVQHLHWPRREMDRLWSCLHTGYITVEEPPSPPVQAYLPALAR